VLAPTATLAAFPRHKTRIAIVGTGVRGLGMWGQELLAAQGDWVELVGLCDSNPLRVAAGKKLLNVTTPIFTDFEKMVRQAKPERIIVATVDAAHHESIIQGMKMGCDVITEKPMTTDEKKCQAILDTEKKTGQKVVVAFNYRYSPHREKIKEILKAGEIGEVVSADFHWYLDTSHGADFFRRWHRLRENSGSLLVHQATHHFDLMNWWLDAEPSEVFAYGKLERFGSNGEFRGNRCLGCPHSKKCNYFWDITKSENLMQLYVGCEAADDYQRDGCVFRHDVNIWDTMAVQVKYSNDVHLSYSLNAFMPYEGYRIAFNGTKGRVEAWIYERQPWQTPKQQEIRLTKIPGPTQIIAVPHAADSDNRLRQMLFAPNAPDPHKQVAGSREGALAVLTGIAAGKSIDEKMPVKINALISL
jgi:predicted dehydrogenase